MKRIVLMLALSLVILSLFGTYAGAFTMDQKVVVSDRLIAVARVPAGGFTATDRIGKVNDRLAYILGFEPLAPRYIRAERAGSDMAIMVGNRLLMTVTQSDARANHTTVAGLTSVWLRAARAAIPQARPNANLPG